jgi:hypothetical protein
METNFEKSDPNRLDGSLAPPTEGCARVFQKGHDLQLSDGESTGALAGLTRVG